MKDTELREARDRAVYQVYLKGLEEGRFSSLRNAAGYICRQPAPRFFIDSRTASLLVGRIPAKISLMDLKPAGRRRVWQLYRNYQRFMDENPKCTLPRERIIEILVEEPAPEFYLTPVSIRHILQREIGKKKKAWAR